MKLSNLRGIIIFIAALLTGIITVALNLGTLTTAIGDKFYDGNYYPQAYFCYSVGALVNSPDCEIRLSYMYENGIAVAEDQSEAEHYAALAHNHGLHIIPTMMPTPIPTKTPFPTVTPIPTGSPDPSITMAAANENAISIEDNDIGTHQESTMLLLLKVLPGLVIGFVLGIVVAILLLINLGTHGKHAPGITSALKRLGGGMLGGILVLIMIVAGCAALGLILQLFVVNKIIGI